MSDIFISYASAGREPATLLSKALQRRKWSVWWDRTIPPGKEYDQVIEEALDSAQCVVVLWSRASGGEFRRLQAADLSHWRGELDHHGLEDFSESIDRKIQGSGVTEAPVIPRVPSPIQPRPPTTQSGRSTRAAWPAVGLIAAVVLVTAGITLWFAQQDESASSVPVEQVSASAPQVSSSSPAPVVPEVVDRPEPITRPPNPPPASPVQFEEVVLVVTKDGETQEVEALLQFGATSLVLKDEDSNIVRTLPYSSIQKATYSRTQRRIMLVRNTALADPGRGSRGRRAATTRGVPSVDPVPD